MAGNRVALVFELGPRARVADCFGDRDVPAQRLIRVTDAVVANSPAFRFARPFSGLDVVERAGDVIAWDGDTPVRAPYDNCVLVMPVPNNVKTGLTAVRLGRIEVPA